MTQVSAPTAKMIENRKSFASQFKKVCHLQMFRTVCEIARDGFVVTEEGAITINKRIGTSGKKADHFFIERI
jgi:hypothetical protein